MSNEHDPSEALLRSMAESSPLAIAVTEGASHVLRYVNPAYCRLYGRTADELVGRPFAEACPEDEPAIAQAMLDRAYETGSAQSVADLHHPQPDGKLAYWSFAAWPLVSGDAVVTQVTDTTATRLAAEARQRDLQQANQQLLIAALREDERSEELIAADRVKDEFVAMLAHELRSPLAALGTGLYLLEQRADPADIQTHETCALMTHQMRHLARLLDDLLDVSRITRGKLQLQVEPVDLIPVLRHAVAATESILELNRHTLSVSLPSDPVWVDGDPVRLEQVMTNLLQNAVKYMDPGGEIWLSLDIVPGGSGGTTDDGKAIIRVRDRGVGMSPEALLHVFDLFVQGDSSLQHQNSGLGIGLTLVHRLVGLHGGTVEARSEGPGRGSEFHVMLPLRPAAPDAAADRVPRGEPGRERKRVLLVEDNVAAAVTLAEVLELWGHEVIPAHTGGNALKAAAAAPPDVVLLDIGLPDMEGYEVARRLRTELGLHAALLVGLTGFGQLTDRSRARDAGFDHYLVKPVDLEELRRVIVTLRNPVVGSGGGEVRS